ncbi:MAG: BrnA antitoxin family protein [Roseiarcus sp.]|jgi:uncharacterized protein (DUF4415 family)
MTAKKPSTPGDFDDDAPDLSAPEWRRKFQAAKVRRGRKPSQAPKISTTIRLDPDVITAFRDEGPGWQSRINAALQEWLTRKKRSLKAQAKNKTRGKAA